MNFENNLSFAKSLDEKDELRAYRNQFHIPKIGGKDCIYFCGNSLGLQPKSTQNYIAQELEDWKNLGVEGHFKGKNPWFSYHHFVTKQSASLVGANEDEVVVMNTLSVNLNLLMVSFYQPTKTKYKIILEADAFPSDHYAVQQQAKFHGYYPEDAIIELNPREGEYALRTEDIIAKIEFHKDEVALVMLGGVNFYTGQYFDIESITQAAHSIGAYCGFDLAHAAGNVPMQLHDWEVDFACWCSYKYLNSGPGGVSGIYIHEDHGNNPDLPRFAGWWGNDEKSRFDMDKKFVPAKGATSWQMSNAPVLSIAAHWSSLDIFDKVGLDKLRAKSIMLTNYLEWLIENSADLDIKIITPKNVEERGCQLSLLTGSNGRALFEHLEKNGVIADWRDPNYNQNTGGVIRVAPVPLYNTFEDVWHFVDLMNTFNG